MLQIMRMSLRLLVVGGLLISLLLYVQTKTVHAQTAAEQVCSGLGAAVGGDGACTDPEGSESLDNTVKMAINVVSLVVGIIAVFMVIVGGLKYVSSQGDSSGIASAKNTIIYAMVGLVIVALSQVMVRFVLQRSTDDTQSASTSSDGSDVPQEVIDRQRPPVILQ